MFSYVQESYEPLPTIRLPKENKFVSRQEENCMQEWKAKNIVPLNKNQEKSDHKIVLCNRGS